MEINDKILVTGSSGMVGSNLVEHLINNGYNNILTPNRSELNLLNFNSVDNYFSKYCPDYVFMIAAKVGGIGANVQDPVGFLIENLEIEINLFKVCLKYKTKKNLFLGSSCIYPKDSPQPMNEEYLMTGVLEPTNEGYALSKIVGLKLTEYYYKQYGMLTVCPMPCNIYGTNDHFDLEKSHVLTALVKKFVDASLNDSSEVVLWGTGVARREFIHVSDVVRGLLFLMNNYDKTDIINLGTGIDHSIKELAEIISRKVGYKGNIFWDSSKPDGMMKKCMSIEKLKKIGFNAVMSIDKGIDLTIKEYYNLIKRV